MGNNFSRIEDFVRIVHRQFLTNEDYKELCECETVEEVNNILEQKGFFGKEPEKSESSTPIDIVEKSNKHLVWQMNKINEMGHGNRPLIDFMQFIRDRYSIINFLKICQSSIQGRSNTNHLIKFHPLGLFEGIEELNEMDFHSGFSETYEKVISKTHLKKYFLHEHKKSKDEETEKNLVVQEFEELSRGYSIQLIQFQLVRNHIELFYKFMRKNVRDQLSVDMMSEILCFEVDLLLLRSTREMNRFNNTGSINQNRELKYTLRKYSPTIGRFSDLHKPKKHEHLLLESDTDQEIIELLKKQNKKKRKRNEYRVFIEIMNTLVEGKKNLEQLEMEKFLVMGKNCLRRKEFCLGMIYLTLKLREQEIRNIHWITSCIHQGVRKRIEEYLPLFSQEEMKRLDLRK